jgi:hypothetical protein
MPGPSPQSCAACRRAKRKCSGHQPACTRCVQTDRECVYPLEIIEHTTGATRDNSQLDSESTDVPLSTDTTLFSDVDDRVGQLEPCQAYFLDADFFHRTSTLKLSQKAYQLTPELYNEVQTHLLWLPYDLDVYFQSTHCFFPIGNA